MGNQVLMDCQVLKEKAAYQVEMVRMVLMEHLGCRDKMVMMEHQACEVTQALLEPLDSLVLKETLEEMV